MSCLSTCSRRRFVMHGGAAALAVIGAPALAQSAPTRIRYQLDWRFEAGTAAHVLALRKGYFAEEGLDVSLNVGAGAAATVTRLASGNFDMGTGDLSSLAEFAGNNGTSPALAVMALYETTPAAVISLRKSAIARPADLKGKVLAAPANDGARRIFPLFANANGLDAQSDVKWMSVEPAIRETLLARGQVDAITGYVASGFVSLQRLGVSPDDISMMRFADFGVPLYGNAVLASKPFLQEKPAAVAAYLRALTRGYRDAAADRAGAVAALKAHEPLVDEKIEALRLDVILDQEIGTPEVRKAGIGGIDAARYQRGIDALAAALAFKSVPQAPALIDMRHLPDASARRIFAS